MATGRCFEQRSMRTLRFEGWRFECLMFCVSHLLLRGGGGYYFCFQIGLKAFVQERRFRARCEASDEASEEG